MPLSRRAVEADQLQKLNALLNAIRHHNPFYAARLRAIGPGLDDLEQLGRKVPFTRKQDLIADQMECPPYGSNLTYPHSHYTRFSQTSATTGNPMRWLDTPESWDWMLGNWRRVFEAAAVSARDRIYFAFSFGPFLGFWTAFDAAARMGCLCIPGGGMRSSARVRQILDMSATVLCCTPTYAIRLAEKAGEEEIDLSASRVRTIITAGEPGGSIAGTRKHISDLWQGANVVDQHGMTEIGPVSYGCPSRPGVLHIIEASFIVEVIDPESGEAVPRGIVGELVLTNLGRVGSPLLRYRTGDMVQAAAADGCACGTSDLALIGGILGRTDDMVVVRGVNVYPSAVDDVLRASGGVAEYRVEVRSSHAMAELLIQVEPTPEHAQDQNLAHKLEMALTNAFALRIPVRMAPAGSLPRFEMKARRWERV
jgi:phenylacetate-CoA ligase